MHLRSHSVSILFALILAATTSAATSTADSVKTRVRAAKPQPRASVAPADSASDSTRIALRVQRASIVGRPIADTLTVTLLAPGRSIAGFDLKIASTSPYLRIVNILRGEILDSCRWEYFHVRELPATGKPGRPPTLWQAVALANTAGSADTTKCYGFQREASLLKVIVSNSHVLQMPETTAALFFYWEDCTDNVLSGQSGEQLYMSVNVLDYYPVDLLEREDEFPTHKGALKRCINPRAANRPKRVVEFHNGGVQWKAIADTTGGG